VEIMTELSTLDSFIVRIYRINTNDISKITGIIEALDGSGKRESFADLDELGMILTRFAGNSGKGRKKRNKSENNIK
jgi:hypothetical protein